MNKKTLTKIMTVFLLAGVVGAGVAGVSGCKKHYWSDEYTVIEGTGKHARTCSDCDKLKDAHDGEWDDDNDPDCNHPNCTVKREIATTALSLDKQSVTFTVNNGTQKITPTVTPSTATDKIEWTSSNESVATVAQDGTVTAVGYGSAVIKAKSGTIEAECPVAVNYNWAGITDESLDAVADVTGTPAEIGAPKLPASVEPEPPVKDDAGKIISTSEFVPSKTWKDGGEKMGADGWTDGIFTISANTEVRNRNKSGAIKNDEGEAAVESFSASQSLKLGGSTDSLTVSVPAPGKITLYVQNGSSSAGDWVKLDVVSPEGSTVPEIVQYPGALYSNSLQLVEIDADKAGDYTISRNTSGTTDIYYAKVVAKVEDTDIDTISVANQGKTEYLVGEQLDLSGVSLTATHKETRRVSSLNAGAATYDTSAVNMAQAGVYTVGVSYTDSKGTYTTSYQVNVYSYDDLTLGFNATVKDANSAVGNSVYANHAVKRLYKLGEAIDTDGLTATIKGTAAEGVKKEFIKKADALTIATVDTSTAGMKAVKVSYTVHGVTKTRVFAIYVMPEIEDLKTATHVDLKVDAAYTGNVGQATDGVYNFKSIQQAMDFLDNSGIPAEATKTLNLAAGTYTEKIEITCPNLTLKGADKATTVIEWDSLYGIPDESGYYQVTDSTQTVAVRDTAVGFKMSGVTVNNKFCTQAYFNEVFGQDKPEAQPTPEGVLPQDAYKEHRALAMLIMADKVEIDDCIINGYQDTIELFTGRQIIKNTLITGTTDFIFGTNNTTYFYNCEIKSIVTYSTDGGYITAFKGQNKNNDDRIKYGAIFDKCRFTYEQGVSVGKTSIGRTWGKTAAVMVMNSELGAHISKTNGEKRNDRYVNMNGQPKSAQFTEYNNTGDGAITASQTGVSVLSEADAAKYNDFSVIFGKENGKVTYEDAWTPEKPQ